MWKMFLYMFYILLNHHNQSYAEIGLWKPTSKVLEILWTGF
jgi:hypothetical protein